MARISGEEAIRDAGLLADVLGQASERSTKASRRDRGQRSSGMSGRDRPA